MTLQTLEVRDFRCIEHAVLEFDSRCTLVAGANASGKTSLLESIHFLSCGRSFRTSHTELLARADTPGFSVIGRVGVGERDIPLGIRVTRDLTELRFAGQAARGFAELAAALPVQVIEPGIHRLLEDGPRERRRFVDWGVFHVEPGFVDAWRRYQRALRQRNAALKAKLPRQAITTWDAELAAAGRLVTRYRRDYIVALAPFIVQTAGNLLGLSVAVEYRQGWSEGVELSQVLEESFGRDVRLGSTSVGPHRSDLAVTVEGATARERVSRGQQKLLAAGLTLAQLTHRASLGSEPACLLLDDPAAELDVDNLRRLLDEVSRTPAQLIVTTVDFASVDSYLGGKRFHVEQGRLRPML